MNEARPAVQLAWPHQLVNTAPSLAIWSMLGVGCPSAWPPPYAPKSFQPVSSVIRMTMLGLLASAANAAMPKVANAALITNAVNRFKDMGLPRYRSMRN